MIATWLCDIFRANQILFRPGLPISLAGLRKPTYKGKKRQGGWRRENGEREGKGRGRKGPAPLSQIPGSASAILE